MHSLTLCKHCCGEENTKKVAATFLLTYYFLFLGILGYNYIMKKYIYLIYFIFLAVLCSCSIFMTKDDYLSDFKKFIDTTILKHSIYKGEDWEKSDKKMDKFSNELYNKFKSKLTSEDELVLMKYRIQYDLCKAKDMTKETFQIISNFLNRDDTKESLQSITNILNTEADSFKSKIDDYVNNNLGNDLNLLKEKSQEIGNSLRNLVDGLNLDNR